jgi:hypothetical protein
MEVQWVFYKWKQVQMLFRMSSHFRRLRHDKRLARMWYSVSKHSVDYKFYVTPSTYQYEKHTDVPVSRYLNLQHWN